LGGPTPDVFLRRSLLRPPSQVRSERYLAACHRGGSSDALARWLVGLWTHRQLHHSFLAIWLQPAVRHSHDGARWVSKSSRRCWPPAASATAPLDYGVLQKKSAKQSMI